MGIGQIDTKVFGETPSQAQGGPGAVGIRDARGSTLGVGNRCLLIGTADAKGPGRTGVVGQAQQHTHPDAC